MKRLLLIGPSEKEQIAAIVERARANPLPLDFVKQGWLDDRTKVTLQDAEQAPKRPRKSEGVSIPIGYLAAFSFEHQPGGLCRHLSVSVDTPGRLPDDFSMLMIAQAFGFEGADILEPKPFADVCWNEEFEPGHYAVNLVQLVTDQARMETDVPVP
jgi:hypothetical protein